MIPPEQIQGELGSWLAVLTWALFFGQFRDAGHYTSCCSDFRQPWAQSLDWLYFFSWKSNPRFLCRWTHGIIQITWASFLQRLSTFPGKWGGEEFEIKTSLLPIGLNFSAFKKNYIILLSDQSALISLVMSEGCFSLKDENLAKWFMSEFCHEKPLPHSPGIEKCEVFWRMALCYSLHNVS